MKRTCFFILISLFGAISLFAQMTVEEINHRLDTRPYFRLDFDYRANIILPDSVQIKFARALNREIPEAVFDSLLALTPYQIEQIKQIISQRCGGDTLCIEEQFQAHIKDRKEGHRVMHATGIMPTRMILAAGSWQVKKAIPILENAVGDAQYDQIAVLMALAKLGNDSIRQVLVNRYTLSYILQTTPLDTIDDNYFYGDCFIITLFDEGMKVAMYLRNKDIILNLLDLIYIRGTCDWGIGVPYTVTALLRNLRFPHFIDNPNIQTLSEIINDYVRPIRGLQDRNLTRREQRELDRLLSTEYRTRVKNQIRDWIIENVNFD